MARKENDLTVWGFPYRKSYYLTHPWKWFGQIGRNIHAAYLRSKKGYCWWDWQDLDSWFLIIFPDMLRDMAAHGYGYPGDETFDTIEKWHDWLNRMADQLDRCQEKDDYVGLSNDPLFRKTMNEIMDHWDCLWD